MALRGAFWVNPGNPKTILFIVAFQSPFADPAPGPHRLADPWPWPDLYGDRYSCYFRVRRGGGYGAVAGLVRWRVWPQSDWHGDLEFSTALRRLSLQGFRAS